jgi:hypothetical protein
MNAVGRCGLDSVYMWFRIGSGSERDNETSDSRKDREFDQVSGYKFIMKDSLLSGVHLINFFTYLPVT